MAAIRLSSRLMTTIFSFDRARLGDDMENQAHAVTDGEAGIDAGQIGTNRWQADFHDGRDLLVALAAEDQLNGPLFPSRAICSGCTGLRCRSLRSPGPATWCCGA